MRSLIGNMRVVLCIAVVCILSGCNHGGTSAVEPCTVSGTASEGFLITGKKVMLKDAAGALAPDAITDEITGAYSFDVTGLTAPFLVTVTGTSGTYVSIARTTGTANINPITTAVVALAAGTSDISTLFTNLTPAQLAVINSNYPMKCTLVTIALQAVLPNGVSASDYFMGTVAPGSDMDAFFDSYLITINPADGIVVKTKDAVPTTLLTIPATAIAENSNALLPEVTTLPPPVNNSTSIPPDILDAANNLAPTIMLHPDEWYYPVSIDWYLAQARFRSSPTSTEVILSKPTATTNKDRRTFISQQTSTHSFLIGPDINNDGYPSVQYGLPPSAFTWGIGPTTSGPQNWPAYIVLSKVTVTNQPDEYLIAQYNMFYSYNSLSGDTANLFCMRDYHYADWERVSMIYSRPVGTAPWQFKAVMTKAHNEQARMTTQPHYIIEGAGLHTGRVKVWAAKRAHGTHLDTYWLCTSLDECKDGAEWNMRTTSNEIVKYTTFTFGSVEEFDSREKLANANQHTVFHGDGWDNFKGKWGQRVTNSFRDYSESSALHCNWGDSPGTYLGISHNCSDPSKVCNSELLGIAFLIKNPDGCKHTDGSLSSLCETNKDNTPFK